MEAEVRGEVVKFGESYSSTHPYNIFLSNQEGLCCLRKNGLKKEL